MVERINELLLVNIFALKFMGFQTSKRCAECVCL